MPFSKFSADVSVLVRGNFSLKYGLNIPETFGHLSANTVGSPSVGLCGKRVGNEGV